MGTKTFSEVAAVGDVDATVRVVFPDREMVDVGEAIDVDMIGGDEE